MLTHSVDGAVPAGSEAIPPVSPTTGLVIDDVPIGDASPCAVEAAAQRIG